MTSSLKRPDPNVVLAQLKDFQQNTVEYVFQHLYLDNENNRNRFLIADEVGLGKTLVARGIIAKAIDYLWESTPRIDILYICSNRDIAQQNINRLAIPGLNHFTPTDRITLLPLISRGTNHRNFKEEKVNFVPLTPMTSFDLRSQYGVKKERALLYLLINRVMDLPTNGAMHVFSGDANKVKFRYEYIPWFEQYFEIDESLASAFIEALMGESGSSLRAELVDLCNLFQQSRKSVRNQHRLRHKKLINGLRRMLATVCADALEPDLIILDEFQRFKYLLNDDNPVGELAQTLFKFEDARTLLLSATPYKMYTLYDETNLDDHYRDFLSTMDFLFHSEESTKKVRQLLQAYRSSLFTLAENDQPQDTGQELQEIRLALQNHLRRVMVRTEKLAASADRSGLIQEVPTGTAYLEPQDFEVYVALSQVSDLLEKPNPLEYWKSAPYLLNFMDNYELKRAYIQALTIADQRNQDLASILNTTDPLLLDVQQMVDYQSFDPGNSRLRKLLVDMVDEGGWRLLWLPPTLPYYTLDFPFSQPGMADFTKRLVFSAWHVVPKTISSLISYEVERRIANEADRDLVNSPEARKKLPRLLQFARSDERLTGMPVLGIMYPSTSLARLGDPLDYFLEHEGENEPPLVELEAEVAQKVESLLRQYKLTGNDDKPVDERWYWAAPLLLDLHEEPALTRSWWTQDNLAALWAGVGTDHEDGDDTSLWAVHVNLARSLVEGDGLKKDLGRHPEDLYEVLAQMALAGPGVTSLRAIGRITGGKYSFSHSDLRLAATSVAWAFRALFNVPDVMLLVRGIYQESFGRTPYWKLVLNYLSAGCIQAVLDEYAHVLREALGLVDKNWRKTGHAIADAMSNVIKLRPASLKIDQYKVSPNGDSILADDFRFRTHFAMRFGDIHGEDDKTVGRKELVREAFNSPFWPFVLATTSVGQEGLDFHLYCHAVVHWNLPANPVDLEQREGRVHRYKGHAIRKNLVHKLSDELQNNGQTDIWQELFALGQRFGDSDMVPFWIFPDQGTPKAFIERHVPAAPLSKDAQRLELLRRALTVYRMVFGQNRQEDLVNYLLDRIPTAKVEAMLSESQIDLSPPEVIRKLVT